MRPSVLALGALLVATPPAHAQPDPLPSWNEGPAKQAIVQLVKAATNRTSPLFVPPEDRIATFDQDGTLWVEHPLYAQAMFALDRVRALAPAHPEWQTTEPFKTALSDDNATIRKLAEADWETIIAATHAGMSSEDFVGLVKDWLEKAKHPRFGRSYTDLVYKPMLEAMRYLRANGWKTYIVTGGGQEFVRAYSEPVYGVPPEQVSGKPVGIDLFTGKRPQAAFGNSSGDAEMLAWTQAGGGARLMMLVHHDDAEREYAYGPAGRLADTRVGTFPQALLDEANRNRWIVVSMKRDWKRLFSFEPLAGR